THITPPCCSSCVHWPLTPWSRPELRCPHSRREWRSSRALPQAAAEALDAAAGLLQVFGLGGIRDAERRPQPEGGALHHRHPLGFQQLGHEILVGGELATRRRGLADGL